MTVSPTELQLQTFLNSCWWHKLGVAMTTGGNTASEACLHLPSWRVHPAPEAKTQHGPFNPKPPTGNRSARIDQWGTEEPIRTLKAPWSSDGAQPLIGRRRLTSSPSVWTTNREPGRLRAAARREPDLTLRAAADPDQTGPESPWPPVHLDQRKQETENRV